MLRQHDVLEALLHSLSQPLTGLRCSLDVSLDESAEEQKRSMLAALEQTGRVIEVVKLMQEYLEIEHAAPEKEPVALRPALDAVLEQLSVLAEARHVHVRLHIVEAVPACVPVVHAPELRLRAALRDLIGTAIDLHPVGSEIGLTLDVGPSEAKLRLESYAAHLLQASSNRPAELRIDAVEGTLRRARLAMAARVLESAGAAMESGNDRSGEFCIRIPQSLVPPDKMSTSLGAL